MSKIGYVYILSNKGRTTFYIGVTSSVERRLVQHRSGLGSAFTWKYKLFHLVYVESIHGMRQAIAREKQLKRWHRSWKINLIRAENPDMKDLAADW